MKTVIVLSVGVEVILFFYDLTSYLSTRLDNFIQA